MEILAKNNTGKLPKSPGVYFFLQGKNIFYIGKAANIQKRVKNHFQSKNLKSNIFLKKVKKIGFIKTGSEIEALLLEAELIKKHQPKFNVIWRDDKNYFYIVITKEKLPRVIITHQPEKNINSFGPFVDGKIVKKTLRLLRKAFPYYTSKKHPKDLCPWCHLNLCPGPNPDIKKYKRDLKNLVSVLKGKKKSVLKNLEKEMKKKSKENDFEEAAKIRDQIFAIKRILEHAKIFESLKTEDWKITQNYLKKLFKKNISRIEAYDVSNIQGQKATGSMVTFINGKPEKDLYRKFKIKISGKPNDTAMIKEILKRRLKHDEWKMPDLILIDGGKPQLSAAKSVIKDKILVTALAKKNNELFIKKNNPILLKDLPKSMSDLILQLRDEAHRFAITYHKKLREIDLGLKT